MTAQQMNRSRQEPLEADVLVDLSNLAFKRFTSALAEGKEQVGMVIVAPPDDIECIRLSLAQLLDRIQIEAVIEATRKGIVVRRKTEAD